jgi:hypothetical protein
MLIDLERHKLPKLNRCGTGFDRRLGEMQSAPDRNMERLRQFPRKAQDNRDVGAETPGDATFCPVDARDLIARQQVVKLLWLEIHGLGNGRQIIDWQTSSWARNKRRGARSHLQHSKPRPDTKMSSLSPDKPGNWHVCCLSNGRKVDSQPETLL